MNSATSSIYEVDIHDLSAEGHGIGRLADGKVVFVEAALPTERIACRIKRHHKSRAIGEVVEVLRPAPERAFPPCSHYQRCGGCSLQHLSTSAQIMEKEKRVLSQLRHVGKVEPGTIIPPLIANDLGYRHKARLGVKFVEKKGRLLIGFRERNGRYLADIDACLILHPKVSALLPKLSELLANLSVYRNIPQLEVAVGDTALALILRHMTPLSASDLEELKAFSGAEGVAFYLQPAGPESIKPLLPSPPLNYHLSRFNVTIDFEPNDFIQINPRINEQLVDCVVSAIMPKASDHILDCFCGLGNFSLPLARSKAHVTGVEHNATLVERAQGNAKRNHLSTCQFIRANLDDAEEIKSLWQRKNYSKLVIDPPRGGADTLLRNINLKQIERLCYVSCNPATLARDAGFLVHAAGFALEHIRVADMFPHTSHVESIALFSR